MESQDRPLEFKDCLRQLIEDNGGMSPDNLQCLVRELRKVKPDFSMLHLQNLIRGHKPSDDDQLAVSETLVPESERWMSSFCLLEDRQSREWAMLSFRKYRSHVLAKDFVEHLREKARFRSENLTANDVDSALDTFHNANILSVDREVFSL